MINSATLLQFEAVSSKSTGRMEQLHFPLTSTGTHCSPCCSNIGPPAHNMLATASVDSRACKHKTVVQSISAHPNVKLQATWHEQQGAHQCTFLHADLLLPHHIPRQTVSDKSAETSYTLLAVYTRVKMYAATDQMVVAALRPPTCSSSLLRK